MNNERAIDLIRRIKTEETHEREIDKHEAFDLAISALEKQIPRKPLYESLADRFCPVCGVYINFDALNEKIEEAPEYCSNCGQKMSWEEEKE